MKINVLTNINGNTLSGLNEVCRDLTSPLITGNTVTGGNGTYSYLWQDSTASVPGWNTLLNVTSSNYQPEVLANSKYFRRIVKSGLNDCCIDLSLPFYIKINELPQAILSTQNIAICNGDSLQTSVSIISGTPPFNINLKGVIGNNEYSKDNLKNGTNNYKIKPELGDSVIIESVTDAKGCVATSKSGSIKVRLITVPIANAGLNDDTCGLFYTLEATPSIGSGLWKSESGIPQFSQGAANPKTRVTFNAYGIYTLIWTEKNEICADSANISITFFQQPQKPEIGANRTLSYQFTDTISVTPPTVGSGIWSTLTEGIQIVNPEEPSAQFSNLVFGDNVIVYTVTNGVCPSVSDTITVIVDDIKRYTGFSPNGDNVNDYFVIDGLLNAAQKSIKILNRWGTVVYSNDDYDNKWNGTNNNGDKLPDDTYFYILKLDNNREYKGYVVLKR